MAPIISLIKNGIMPLIYFAVPIILIILVMLDLAKIVIASKEEEIQKNKKVIIRRFINAVCVYFVLVVGTTGFNLLISTDSVSAEEINWHDCWVEN